MNNQPPINLVIIGNGHYSTGHTVLSNETATDKDFGILLPSALELRSQGKVGLISLCGRDGNKFQQIREKIRPWKINLGMDTSFKSYPSPGIIDSKAYIQALNETPMPCAVLIAVPDNLHVEVMLECVSRNIPFLIVKPAVTRLNDYYKVKAAIGTDLLAMVDYHKVYDESNLLLLEDIKNKTYGNIQHISSLMSQRRDMIEIYLRWLTMNPAMNVNHYLGSHYIHLTGFLTKATPVDVRATQQFGFIKRSYNLDIADSIQTQIRWRSEDGYIFTSYHVAGWADPSETESMTFQQIHLLTEKGHIFSDQRYRGTRKILSESGIQAPNPYFFSLTNGLLGKWNLQSKYGFQSIDNFLNLVHYGFSKEDAACLPTFIESENVTAILEAADLSLSNDSSVISVKKYLGRLLLE